MDKRLEAFNTFMMTQAPHVERLENEDAIVYNVYKRMHFDKDEDISKDERLIDIPVTFLDESFENLNIRMMLPAVILTPTGTYYPGEDEYDPEIEFFSVMVQK